MILPHIVSLYSYYLQLIQHAVWVTELQYNAWVEMGRREAILQMHHSEIL